MQREILEFAKPAALFASLEYAAGAAGAAVRGKELLGYAARVVRFPVERADRRIRSSNSGVDRHCKISVIYTGCTPAVSLVDEIVSAKYKIDSFFRNAMLSFQHYVSLRQSFVQLLFESI